MATLWVSKEHHMTYWKMRLQAVWVGLAEPAEYVDAAEIAEIYKDIHYRKVDS